MKKLLSLVLSVLLALGALPYFAFADTAETQAKQPKIFIDFNDKTATDTVGNTQTQIVGNVGYVTGADGTSALHLKNAFGEKATQYLKLPNVTFGDGDFTISLMYRATGSGGLQKWNATDFTYDPDEKMFKGFGNYNTTVGGTVFSTTDLNAATNAGVSLLNIPSCYDGTYLVSDGTNTINKRQISRIQDTSWHSVVLSVKRSGNVVFYIDGEQYYSTSAATVKDSLNNDYNTLNFGADALGNWGCGNGEFDNIAIFDSALTAQEVVDYTARDLYAYEVSLATDALLNAKIGTRYTEKSVREFTETVNLAAQKLNDATTDFVTERTALRTALDNFQAGEKTLATIAVVSDTHICEDSVGVNNNKYQTEKFKLFAEKAIELGCTTMFNAGDYSQARDSGNQQKYFDYENEYFLQKGGKLSVVCLGNHQFSHAMVGGNLGGTDIIDVSTYIDNVSDRVDPTLTPNKSIVDADGKLTKTYYYATDGVANYLAINEFEKLTGQPTIYISETQWDWIFSTLDYCKTTGKPTFIIGHIEYSNLSTYKQQFNKIINDYDRVTYVSGDSHHGLAYGGIATRYSATDNSKKMYTIDCPSSGNSDCHYGLLDNSCFYLYLYEDCYVLRAYNLVTESFLPALERTVYFNESEDFAAGDIETDAADATEITEGLNKATAYSYAYSAKISNNNISQKTYDEIFANNAFIESDYYAGDVEYVLNENTNKYEANALSETVFVKQSFKRTQASGNDRLIPHTKGGSDQTVYTSGTKWQGNTSLATALANGTKLGDGPIGVMLMDFTNVRSISSLLIGNGQPGTSRIVTDYDVYVSSTLGSLFNKNNKVFSYKQNAKMVNTTTDKWYYNSTTKEFATETELAAMEETEKANYSEITFADSQFIEFTGSEKPMGRYVAIVANNGTDTSYPRGDFGELAAFTNYETAYNNLQFKDLSGNVLKQYVLKSGPSVKSQLTEQQLAELIDIIPDVEGMDAGITVGTNTYYWNINLEKALEGDTSVIPVYSCNHTKTHIVGKINATCTKEGYSGDTICVCGKTVKKGTSVAKKAHTLKTTVTKATLTKNGKTVKACTVCKKTVSTVNIAKVNKFTLSKTKYVYDGKAKKPTVTVKDANGKKLTLNKDYTVAYSSNKYVGKATVKVTLKGNYSGTKTLYFTISPKAATLKSVTGGKKQVTVKWNKQATQTSGYQIQYSTSSAFKNAKTVTVTSNKTTSKTVKNLNAGKKYYVRVRTYKTVKNTKYYSAWSAKKYATAKKK